MPIENDVDLVAAVHKNPTVQAAVVAHLDSGEAHTLKGADGVLASAAISRLKDNPNLAPAMRPFEPTIPPTLEERIAKLEAAVFPASKAAKK